MATRFSDPWKINADLHSHSHQSDGVLAPAEVASRAHAQGVQLWSLTDHDELSGIVEAQRQADALGLRFVAGVEVSVTWANKTIHILGLNVDPNHQQLNDGLATTRAGRIDRAHEMAAGLAAVGINDAYQGALRFVRNPNLIARTHFARFLVDAGHCTDTSEVFYRYLIEGKPGFVPHRWAKLHEAVGWIRAAGGEPVVAHPARYNFSETESWAFFSEFAQAGGNAIEIVSSSHSRDHIQRFSKLAQEFGFRGSRGSDFHSADDSHVELGQVATLPDSVLPVWSDWIDDEAMR